MQFRGRKGTSLVFEKQKACWLTFEAPHTLTDNIFGSFFDITFSAMRANMYGYILYKLIRSCDLFLVGMTAADYS
jgi:hypothetical protein